MQWENNLFEEYDLGTEVASAIYVNKSCTGPIPSNTVVCDRGQC